ncbi:MAG: hypothetical protein NTY46_13865 [Candidatus Sumerlaeota bacterium]|nr:hypothetical protein [Candidatus Sumerlaeota bacterium]
MAINHAGRLIIVLLALRVLIGFGVAWRQTVTVDEPDFIASGLAAWRQGDWTLEPNNPPLTKLLIALPWLAAEAKLPSQDQYREAWNRRDHYAVGKALLFDIEPRAAAPRSLRRSFVSASRICWHTHHWPRLMRWRWQRYSPHVSFSSSRWTG